MNTKRPHWWITGATSAIAKALCHKLANSPPCQLTLFGRDQNELERIAKDLRLKHEAMVQICCCDFSSTEALHELMHRSPPTHLVLAHALTITNADLSQDKIATLLQVNVIASCRLIHWFVWESPYPQQLLFISSVAAHCPRPSNSLYGSSKRCVEHYLQGIKPAVGDRVKLHILRLGLIDTPQTFGLATHRWAASPTNCAQVILQRMTAAPKITYFPKTWRWVMGVIAHMPGKLLLRLRL